MSRFFVTGDLHATNDMHKLSTKAFEEQYDLTKDDYVIICGDFGGVWYGDKSDKYIQDWLESKSFTTLWVDGNHECFPLLADYEVVEWNGGKVQFITPTVIHLMRGQVYTIDGIKFFTMGGASSHDKEYRVLGKSWWLEEMPSDEEYAEALSNLDKNDWKVDIVLSHCAPDSIQAKINPSYEHDKLTNFFETIKDDLTFQAWFFGHYHTNKVIDSKYCVLYEQIVELENE